MRHLLRRALALAIALSVVLPTLGLAYAPCDARGAAVATHRMHATHDMTAGAPHEAPAPSECAHETRAPGPGDAPAACLLATHCVGMMPARHEVEAPAATPAQARLAPTDDMRPAAPALEIDSPPPRG